jgi:hypothetical protein
MMLEYGISQQTLPQETRLRKLVTFMKDYGTDRMDRDRIIGYLRRLDEAMKRVPISDSIRRVMIVQNVERKRINLLSIGKCALPSQISFPLSANAHRPFLDGGSSGLLALYTLNEMLSRLAFDLKSNESLLAWRHFELMIGTGPGG